MALTLYAYIGKKKISMYINSTTAFTIMDWKIPLQYSALWKVPLHYSIHYGNCPASVIIMGISSLHV